MLQYYPSSDLERGNTALFSQIGQDDGLRLTTNTRFNFSSGKGAIDAELSYPLDRIVDSSLNIYVFGQGFAGYGENLLDYDRKTTRLRIGIRSEEHTSELQSLMRSAYAVFCLKKKKHNNIQT